MKKHIHSTSKARVIRATVYLHLLPALCVARFVLGQQTAGSQSLGENTTRLPITASDSSTAAGPLPMPEFPAGFVLWNQYDNPAMQPPINIGSQDFESAFASLTDQAADDFVFTYPFNNCITSVRVMGEYSAGGGPASSFNVYVYDNGAGNLPGTLIAMFPNRPYTGAPPDFTITLPNPFCRGPGIYWISVQARQDFNPNGQWSWHNRTVQSNAGAAWQNPGNGYGTGCVTWNRKNACMPDQAWPDQVFAIVGFEEGPPPTATPTSPPRATPTPRVVPTPMTRPTPPPRP